MRPAAAAAVAAGWGRVLMSLLSPSPTRLQFKQQKKHNGLLMVAASRGYLADVSPCHSTCAAACRCLPLPAAAASPPPHSPAHLPALPPSPGGVAAGDGRRPGLQGQAGAVAAALCRRPRPARRRALPVGARRRGGCRDARWVGVLVPVCLRGQPGPPAAWPCGRAKHATAAAAGSLPHAPPHPAGLALPRRLLARRWPHAAAPGGGGRACRGGHVPAAEGGVG